IALSSPVTPTHAEKSGAVPVSSGVVSSASGASVSVGSGESETATGGLGVGLPWTPPVAALAIVPATTSTAHAMSRTLSGFMGSVWPDGPHESIGQTTVSWARRGTTQVAGIRPRARCAARPPGVRLDASRYPRGGRHGLAGCAPAAVECDSLPQDVRVLDGEPERRAARRDEQRRLDGGLQRRPRPGGAGD